MVVRCKVWGVRCEVYWYHQSRGWCEQIWRWFYSLNGVEQSGPIEWLVVAQCSTGGTSSLKVMLQTPNTRLQIQFLISFREQEASCSFVQTDCLPSLLALETKNISVVCLSRALHFSGQSREEEKWSKIFLLYVDSESVWVCPQCVSSQFTLLTVTWGSCCRCIIKSVTCIFSSILVAGRLDGQHVSDIGWIPNNTKYVFILTSCCFNLSQSRH